MDMSAHVVPPHCHQALEQTKIIDELRQKYGEEIRRASWWGRILIRLRISREADRIFRQRLYLPGKTGVDHTI